MESSLIYDGILFKDVSHVSQKDNKANEANMIFAEVMKCLYKNTLDNGSIQLNIRLKYYGDSGLYDELVDALNERLSYHGVKINEIKSDVNDNCSFYCLPVDLILEHFDGRCYYLTITYES